MDKSVGEKKSTDVQHREAGGCRGAKDSVDVIRQLLVAVVDDVVGHG
jgi:hypothetical protein